MFTKAVVACCSPFQGGQQRDCVRWHLERKQQCPVPDPREAAECRIPKHSSRLSQPIRHPDWALKLSSYMSFSLFSVQRLKSEIYRIDLALEPVLEAWQLPGIGLQETAQTRQDWNGFGYPDKALQPCWFLSFCCFGAAQIVQSDAKRLLCPRVHLEPCRVYIW